MATFGVTDTFGLTAPTGFKQSSEQTAEVETATIKNEIGRVAESKAKPRTKTTVTIKCKGSSVLSTIGSGTDFTAITLTSSKFNETNDDFPTSEITGVLYE